MEERKLMLVLTRKRNERIHILVPGGPTIIVQVAQIETDQIRLGFTAPRDVRIVREELLDREDRD